MKNLFYSGFRDGISVALGYFSVSLAFGMLAVGRNFMSWVPIAISVSNFTGTGQFAGLDLIYANSACFEVAFTVLIINLRYSLMSLSLSQKLSEKVSIKQRFAIAFGNTDEIYAVAMRQNGLLDYHYMSGLILCSYLGWTGGTAAGAFMGNLFPQSVLDALGIALYAMFIAIIVPAAKKSSPVLKIIVISVCMSCMFEYIPFLSKLSSGWVIIICGTVSSALGAFLFPISENTEGEDLS